MGKGSRSSSPRSARRGPAVQTSMCVEALQMASTGSRVPLVLKLLFIGYIALQGGFERLWNMWLGIGRGIGGCSGPWSGVCGGPATLPRCTFSLSRSPIDLVTTLPGWFDVYLRSLLIGVTGGFGALDRVKR